jgi:hypothetical protein
VPAPPELVEILRRRIATFPTSTDGRLFVTGSVAPAFRYYRYSNR